MGDRANFGLKQHSGNTLYVYGHWAGSGMLNRFAEALKRAGNRLPGDEAYANRIVISSLVTNHESDTGWGVTIDYISDNEHSVPVYDYSDDTVSIRKYDWMTGRLAEPEVVFTRPRFIEKYAKVEVSA